jgi:hypothetical protein
MPPSLQIPLLVETIRPTESQMGIEAEDLSDNDSKDGLEIERLPKTDVVLKEVESSASDTKSHSNTSIFGKVKSVTRKSSSHQSCASKRRKSDKSVTLDRKELDSIAASFQSSSSKCSKGHQILLESSKTQSIVSHHLAVKHVLFSPKNLRLNWLLPVTQLPPKAARLNLLKGKKVMMHLKFPKSARPSLLSPRTLRLNQFPLVNQLSPKVARLNLMN